MNMNSQQALNILKDNYHCMRDVELFKIIEKDLKKLKERDKLIAYAVKKLNRRYIGIEINPEYFRIAQDRLNGITQKERKIKESGWIDIFDLLENEE